MQFDKGERMAIAVIERDAMRTSPIANRVIATGPNNKLDQFDIQL